MGIASLIIGILSAIIGVVPLCGIIAIVPAIVGLILGIIEMKKKGKAEQPKGMGLAGTILNAVAIAFILVWTLVIAAGAKKAANEMPELREELEKAGVSVDQIQKEFEKAADEMQKETDAE
jgi:hypothetical protein